MGAHQSLYPSMPPNVSDQVPDPQASVQDPPIRSPDTSEWATCRLGPEVGESTCVSPLRAVAGIASLMGLGDVSLLVSKASYFRGLPFRYRS